MATTFILLEAEMQVFSVQVVCWGLDPGLTHGRQVFGHWTISLVLLNVLFLEELR